MSHESLVLEYLLSGLRRTALNPGLVGGSDWQSPWCPTYPLFSLGMLSSFPVAGCSSSPVTSTVTHTIFPAAWGSQPNPRDRPRGLSISL